MRHLVASALAGALLALGPRVATGQPTVPPTIYCVPGATHACFAAAFASSGTSASFWLQNLQGTYTANPTPFTIGALMVERINETQQFAWAPGDASPWVIPEGAVHTPFMWTFSEDSYVDVGPHQRRWYSTEISLHGLAGCTYPFADPGDLFFGWRTCVRDGENGWMRIDFRAFITGAVETPGEGVFIREITLADVNVYVGNVGRDTGCVLLGASSGAPTGIAPACLAFPYDLTTVPEPATIALLGGGLLALGGVGAVRRRHP